MVMGVGRRGCPYLPLPQTSLPTGTVKSALNCEAGHLIPTAQLPPRPSRSPTPAPLKFLTPSVILLHNSPYSPPSCFLTPFPHFPDGGYLFFHNVLFISHLVSFFRTGVLGSASAPTDRAWCFPPSLTVVCPVSTLSHIFHTSSTPPSLHCGQTVLSADVFISSINSPLSQFLCYPKTPSFTL